MSGADIFEGERQKRGTGITGVHKPKMDTDVWLTPPYILDALGPFDLDPCAPEARPWEMAKRHYTKAQNGLTMPWQGRVWLNPPYGREAGRWLARLAKHEGGGTALIFARTETEMFCRWVWGAASAVLFLEGRLHFHHPDGRLASNNSGGPSALVAYGHEDALRLGKSGLPGAFVMGWANMCAGTGPMDAALIEENAA